MMDANGEELAPTVRSILAAAHDRAGGEERRSVDARSFPAALAAAEGEGRVPVIAEVKPTSPTTEGRRDDDPADLARAMVAGGATAISVLTEPEHFGARPTHSNASDRPSTCPFCARTLSSRSPNSTSWRRI